MKKILLTGLCLTSLFSDFTLEYKMDDSINQLVEFKDSKHVKITTEGTSQLIVGEKKYLITNHGGKTEYTDMNEMMKQMQKLSNTYGEILEVEKENIPNPKIKVIKKGKEKIVAGIKGEIWTVEFSEEGQSQQMDVVVTNELDVVDSVQKYVKVISEFSKMSGDSEDMTSFFNIEKGYVLISAEGMELIKFNKLDIDDSIFELPKGLGEKTKPSNLKVTKPNLCPFTKPIGEAKQLIQMLKASSNGWKLLESGTCLNMMNMTIENALYEKNNSYIQVSLAINSEDEKGIVAAYRTNDLEISEHKKGKIQGYRYQSAYLEKAKQYAIDIRLDNAMLTMSKIGNEKVDFTSFANNVLDLSQFIPVPVKKLNANDALKDLGNIFEGKGGNKDMKEAEEMLKNLFGK